MNYNSILEQQSTDGQVELHKNLCQKILQS